MVRVFVLVLFLIGSFVVNVNSGASKFTVAEVIPRIVTPDSPNQQVSIKVESEDWDLAVNGRIFDITGREIASMELEGDFYDNGGWINLTWRPGSNMPSGVYIYQLEAKGYIYNGTIVVAR